MTTQDEFDTKSQSFLDLSELIGELLLFTPTEYIPVERDAAGNPVSGGINTENGRKDAVVTDIAVISQGVEHKDVMILQGHLIGELKRRVTSKRKRLGVLGQGEVKRKGWSAPYILLDASEEQAQMARDYLAGRTVAAATAPDDQPDDPFAV